MFRDVDRARYVARATRIPIGGTPDNITANNYFRLFGGQMSLQY